MKIQEFAALNSSSSGYPKSGDEITKHQIELEEGLVKAVKGWKKEYFTGSWKEKCVEDRLEALCKLVEAVVKGSQRETDCRMPKIDASYGSYVCGSGFVGFDHRNPSIISTLHEVGHWLFGGSELVACVFSYSIFKEVFPAQLKGLEFHGHLLKKCQK
jgi:hypothetical protein